jgi:cellulose synthase/poly-beta-1,6-N-acetylglucosamine synthase-like glycosyltransferase
VFSDANTMCDRGALAALAANFADQSVGGVAGHTSCDLDVVAESSSRGEKLYWGYDTWLKSLESQTGSIVSAHGGLHALRRELYRPISDAAVTDDFAISTSVIEQGYRLVFEPAACAAEVAVPEAEREFRRRVRLMTRGLRGVVLRRQLLNPFRHGIYAFVLFSHKVLRRLAPISLAVLAVSSLWLARGSRFFLAATLAQTAFYSLALVGWGLRKVGAGGLTLFYVPFYYCLSNGACAVALVQLAAGKRIALWQPQRGGI